MCRFEARRTFQNIVQHLQKHLENHLYGATLYLVPGDIPAEGEGDHRDDVEHSTEAAESRKIFLDFNNFALNKSYINKFIKVPPWLAQMRYYYHHHKKYS